MKLLTVLPSCIVSSIFAALRDLLEQRSALTTLTSLKSQMISSLYSELGTISFVAILGAAMTLITVFAPGALGTTTVDFALKQACAVPTVDLSQGTFGVEWFDGNSSAWSPLRS